MTNIASLSQIEETLLKEAEGIGLEPDERISAVAASPAPMAAPPSDSAVIPPANTIPVAVPPVAVPPVPVEKTILQTLADIFKAPAGMKFDTALTASPFSVSMEGVNGDVRLTYRISVQTPMDGKTSSFINVSCWCDRPSHIPETPVPGQPESSVQQAVSASRSYVCDVNIPIDQFIMGTFNTASVQQSVQEKISAPDFDKIYVG